MTRFTYLLKILGVNEDEIAKTSKQGINTLHKFINVEKEEDLGGEDVRKIWSMIKDDFPNYKDKDENLLYYTIVVNAEKYTFSGAGASTGAVQNSPYMDAVEVGQLKLGCCGPPTRPAIQRDETIPIPDDSSRTFEDEPPQSASTLQDATQPVQSSN